MEHASIESLDREIAGYRERKKAFNETVEYPLIGRVRKLIADRIRELSTIEPSTEEVVSVVLLDEGARDCIENITEDGTVRLPLELPYPPLAPDLGRVRRDGVFRNSRLWEYLSVENGSDMLFLEAPSDETVYNVMVGRENVLWLYGKLTAMGFFDDDRKENFEM